MSRRLLFLLPFILCSHLVLAEPPGLKSILDAVPNWESADYACPRVVTTKAGDHIFNHSNLFEYSLRYGKWNYRVPGAREYVDNDFDPSIEQAYLFCGYQFLKYPLIVAAKEAKHCSFRMGLCWKGDPYNFSTPKTSTFYSDKLPKEKLLDWKAVDFACPLNIKIKTGVHKFIGYEMYQYTAYDGDWIHIDEFKTARDAFILPPEREATFLGTRQYSVCHYADTTLKIMMETAVR